MHIASGICLAVFAALLTACGSSGGSNNDPPAPAAPAAPPATTPPPSAPAQPGDVYLADVRSMMGNGEFMADVDIGWSSPDGAALASVGYRLSRGDGTILSQGTTGTIASDGIATVHVMASDLADGETLILAVDPLNAVEESIEDNNERMFIATVAEPPPEPPAAPPGSPAVVDLQFNDTHYHQAYYYNDLAFHFLIQNPNAEGVASGAFNYAIYDGDTEIWKARVSKVEAPSSADRAAKRIPTTDVMVARDKLGRPTPGRHVYTLRLDVDNEVAETNEANNQRRIVIDIPENHVMSATPQEKPDVRLQDPHVHQFWNAVTFHFFIYNFHASTTLPAVKWRVIRVQDGVVIKEGVVSNVVARSTAANAPPASFRYTEEFKGPDVEYLLILDPDNEIDEAYENNNQVKFIIDWTQAGAG